jgi:hypothetical protein
MVNYTCAAGHLCGMNNPSITATSPQHHCLECGKGLCGALCGELIDELPLDITIPYESLSETGRRLYKSPSALICRLCIDKCRTQVVLPAKNKVSAIVVEALCYGIEALFYGIKTPHLSYSPNFQNTAQ